MTRVSLFAILSLAFLAPGLAAQEPLPFRVGERFEYRVSVARFGNVGRGAMWIEGLAEVRGVQTMVLRFELHAGKGPIKAHDRTGSWLDPRRMAALRFEKSEKHPLSRHAESFELYPEAKRWVDEKGVMGESGTDAPLDELSFLYYLRTIAFEGDSAWRFDRHFAADRNPTTLRVIGRRTLATAAGEFRTVEIEMRVRDPRRYKGEGVIRIDLSDDARRIPVRIESTMPVFGKTVLTLEAISVSQLSASRHPHSK
jgi:hypothetical protein